MVQFLPEVKREYFLSYKFTTGGNAWISSVMQIYRRRQCVKILYTANLPPEAMRENITLLQSFHKQLDCWYSQNASRNNNRRLNDNETNSHGNKT